MARTSSVLVALCVSLLLAVAAAAPVCSAISGLLSPVTESFTVLANAGITLAGGTASTMLYNGNVGSYPTPGPPVGTDPKALLINSVDHAADALSQAGMTDLACMYANAIVQSGTTLDAGDIGGLTFPPGVYISGSSIGITGFLTLDGLGDPNAVFLFIAGSSITTAASNSNIVLVNGAQACNVFWVAGSAATLNQYTTFSGTIIAQAAITLNTGAVLTGRALCKNAAVTLNGATVRMPDCISDTATLPNCATNCTFSVSPSPSPSIAPSPIVSPTPTPVPTPSSSPSSVAPSVSPVPVPCVPSVEPEITWATNNAWWIVLVIVGSLLLLGLLCFFIVVLRRHRHHSKRSVAI
jgi:hypothetical protein